MLLFYPRKVISGKEKAKKARKIKKNVAFLSPKDRLRQRKSKKGSINQKNVAMKGAVLCTM